MASLITTIYPSVSNATVMSSWQLVGTSLVGSGAGAPGTSQTPDNGEVGGFVTPTGNDYLMMGSYSSPRVDDRSAYLALNLKYVEYLVLTIRAGNDSNGGERPNTAPEAFYFALSDQSAIAIARSSGGSAGSFPTALPPAGTGWDAYWNSWHNYQINVDSSRRQVDGYVTFSSAARSAPEFDGTGGLGTAGLQNAGDIYGTASIEVWGTIPAPTVTLTANKTYLTYNVDSVDLSWSISDSEFRPTLTNFSSFPDNQLIESTLSPTTNNIYGNGSGVRTPSGLTVGSYTYTLSASNRNTSSTASVTVVVVDIPTADIKINGSDSNVIISRGDSVTISWSSTNASGSAGQTSRDITNLGSVSTSGSQTYTPPSSGVFTITFTVKNAAGYTVTDSVTLQVVSPPVIDSFTADPNPADQDILSTLSWTTTDASSVSIDQGIGGGLPSDGSKDIIPTVPISGPGSYPGAPSYGNGYRIYTMTAKNIIGNANGTTTKTLQLDVKPQPPVVDLNVTPTTINFGESSSLSWTTSYSNTGSIDQGIGGVTPIASGSKTVTVSGNPNNYKSNSSITYTMSVEGYGGKTTGSTVLTVLIDSSPNSWAFNSKSAAKINTQYYASSNTTTPS